MNTIRDRIAASIQNARGTRHCYVADNSFEINNALIYICNIIS
jgi:hypothetical protein